ncbi:YnfA family protein [Acetobacteraceae bacterium ESL0709]|nr:YnfA family protein [Acetobacteraceae bacterium ESL0697]MDF7678736.1 YnfA family protein [Acetobacteraceae bacterium ESL0709]
MVAGFIRTVCVYVAAAMAEIFGCYAFWLFFKEGRSCLWLLPGCVSLACFAWVLTFSPSDQAGRAFAIYGGIYIVSSLCWMWSVEGNRPDLWDMVGAVFCLMGAGIILLVPRS